MLQTQSSEGVQDFFTAASIATLGGASLAVVVISNTFRRLTGRDTPLVGFLVSFVITFAIAYSADALSTPASWLLALVNMCLLFCTAAGMQETAAHVAKPPQRELSAPHRKRHVEWLSSWFT